MIQLGTLEIVGLLLIDLMMAMLTLVLALFVGPVRVEKRIHAALARGDFNEELDGMAKRYAEDLVGGVAGKVKGLLTGDMQLWANAEKGVVARQERAVDEAFSTAIASTAEGKGWIKAIGEFVSPELAAWLDKNPKLLTKAIEKFRGQGVAPSNGAGSSPVHLLPEFMRR